MNQYWRSIKEALKEYKRSTRGVGMVGPERLEAISRIVCVLLVGCGDWLAGWLIGWLAG